MAKRRSIPEGADPLGAILGNGQDQAPPGDGVARFPEASRAKAPQPKKRMAFDIGAELGEGIRDCVMHLSGPPLHLNLSRFAESAFLRELERLQEEVNAGEPFPSRAEDPRPGRPLS